MYRCVHNVMMCRILSISLDYSNSVCHCFYQSSIYKYEGVRIWRLLTYSYYDVTKIRPPYVTSPNFGFRLQSTGSSGPLLIPFPPLFLHDFQTPFPHFV